MMFWDIRRVLRIGFRVPKERAIDLNDSIKAIAIGATSYFSVSSVSIGKIRRD